MTVFRRSSSGLSNLHLFDKVQAIFFVEGGNISYNRVDVEDGSYTESSSDITFWNILLRLYRPDIKVSFRAVGSKATVKSIADDIAAGHITNVIAAMDRDFDHIKNNLVSTDNVLYTYGYSWENDCWHHEVVISTYCILSGKDKYSAKKELTILKDRIFRFTERINRAVLIDAILSQHNDALFDRRHHMRYISCKSKNNIPDLDINQIKDSLSSARKRRSRPVTRISRIQIDSQRDCYGHLFGDYNYKVLLYILNITIKSSSLPKVMAINIVINKLSEALRDGLIPTIYAHYDNEFKKVSI